MDRKATIFTKIVSMIIGILLPVVLLFALSNHTAVQVIEDEMRRNNLSQLQFLHQQMEEKVNQISINAITISNDAAIRELEFQHQDGYSFDRQKLLRMILDNITLHSGISGWNTDITVFSRMTKEIVSTSNSSVYFTEEQLVKEIAKGWRFTKAESSKVLAPEFVWYSVHPITAFANPADARLIVRTSFAPSYLQDMLDQYKADGQGDPFLYHPQFGVIANRTINQASSDDLIRKLDGEELKASSIHFSAEMSGREYLASYMELSSLGWYLVDSVPKEDILSPVTKTRNLFYGSTVLLLLLSLLASYTLYRTVQAPILAIVRHVQKIKRGDYGARLKLQGGTEFVFLIERFNEMTEQIQDLLEKVVAEQIRSREAVLKQLQSQINPHFLYNCLFFMKNMARMGDEEAIVAMALNLGDYFRYTTRLSNQSATLAEELSVIVNYLEIQNLRMRRIEYEIDMPEPMKELVIPRLLLQPLVENAILHGIEPKEGKGTVRITGVVQDGEYRLFIEDNGIGIDDGKLEELQRAVNRGENEMENGGGYGSGNGRNVSSNSSSNGNAGGNGNNNRNGVSIVNGNSNRSNNGSNHGSSFGLWNVNQRIKLTFGKGSGLFFAHGSEGGLSVMIILRLGEEISHVSIADRG